MNQPKQAAFKDERDVVESSILWHKQLDTATPFLAVPAGLPQSAAASRQIHPVSFSLSGFCYNALKQLSKQSDNTLSTTLLSIYATLLFRYTGEEDIVIGFLTHENIFIDKGELKGIHENKRTFRTDLSGNTGFNEVLKRVHQTVVTAGTTKEMPKETLKKGMKLDFGLHSSDLYNVIFSYEDTRFENDEIKDGAPNVIAVESYKSHFDLGLFIEETIDGLKGAWKYNSELFEAATIMRLAKHFNVLLKDIILNPKQTISQFRLLADEENHQLTSEWNVSKIDYPVNKCIHELFEEQARKTPAAIALVFENKELTYREMNERSNQLAHYLSSKGVKQETLVPICIGRSLEMIVAIMGILKAGGAYVPIDPNYPLERIAYLLEDTGAAVVVCNKESKIQLNTFQNIDFVELTYDAPFLKSQPTDNLNAGLSSNNLAYIIYTSGSTGMPKGVMIEHRSLLDHCYGVIDSANLKTCKSFALFSPLVFDAGHSIIHSSLLLGASLHVLSDELITDGERLANYFDNNAIDCIKIVPSLWLSYANLQKIVLPKKVMIFGGETFSLSILNHLIKLNYSGDVYNHYGPTEVTIGKCIYKVDLNKTYHTVPIGKPFSNTQLYVLDDYLRPTPVGIEGELYIAGDGLARGYLNQPNLTIEKFISNPFTTDSRGRIYKTGDKAKWLSDGNIEYLRRADEQIKIQGYRIELGEIENALLQSELVRQTVVLVNADKKGNKWLVAYIVPDKPFDQEVIMAFLRRKLPEYMIPVKFVELENLVLTTNGKIDKKALENLAEIRKKHVAPHNEIERELATIWQDLLNKQRVSIHDNFFEIGGNSIQAVVLFSKIKRKFNKNFPLATIFTAPTIYQLAVVLQETTKAIPTYSSLVPIQPNGSKTPLFCVHAGVGNVLFYGNLSLHLGLDQPFYGLQAKGINGTELPFTKMEQMAGHYINEIRKIQPEGPYYLAGYCLGAQIAFEMAQQLTDQGQIIAVLANFNGISPTYRHPSNNITNEMKEPPVGRFAKTVYHFNNIAKLSLKGKVLYIYKRLKRQVAYKLKKLSNFLLHIVYYGLVFKFRALLCGLAVKLYLLCKLKVPGIVARVYVDYSLGTLQSNYTPKPHSGSMVIFRSPVIYKDPYLGWKNFVKGGIKSIEIPGAHKTRRDIMNEPFVQFLAEEIKNHLDN